MPTDNQQQNTVKKDSSGKLGGGSGNLYLKWTAYGITLLITLVIQSLPHGFPQISGARPILMLPVTMCIAMFEGPVGGAAAGIAGGLLWDLFSSRPMGFNALILLVLCCAVGLLSQLLIRNNLLSSMITILVSLVVQGLLDWFFLSFVSKRPYPAQDLIHNGKIIIYTLVISPLIYYIILKVVRALNRRE